jgi:hypothetical protein
MSDRFTPGETHDAIAHRLVTALDSLPVPAGPSRLRGAVPRSLGREPRVLVLAAALLLVVTAISSPQFREAAAELTRYIQRVLFGPSWTGYYLDLAARDAAGNAAPRLLVVSPDRLTGMPLTPDIAGPLADHGPWSPDGERIVVYNGPKIYVGDRRGSVREIADVDSGFVAQAGWIGNDRVFAVLNTSTGIAIAGSGASAGPSSFATIDLTTGAIDVRPLETVQTGRAFAAVSPDGRWLPLVRGPGACGTTVSLYDLSTHQIVPVIDAQGRGLSAAVFFLSDGRMVTAWCDRAASSLELYVGAPGSIPMLIATLSAGQDTPMVIVKDDEILIIGKNPVAAQTIPVFDPTGRVVRTIQLPQLTTDGTLNQAGLSRDGRTFSFVLREIRGREVKFRAGVVDIATGQVTFVCDVDCARLAIGGR